MVGIRPRRASRDRLATFYPAEAHLPLHRARTAQGCSSSYSKATSICILPEAVARRSGRRLASGLKMHTGIAAPQQPALGTRRLSSCSRLVAQVGAVTCSRRPNGGAAADRRRLYLYGPREGRCPPAVPRPAVCSMACSTRVGTERAIGLRRRRAMAPLVCVCVLGEPRAAGRQA